ncbi:ArpU family phage packaging/lysis transcriptional regulator [Priestia flexa]|uniref:ArpU family phage packaging/lysis transcriptional regulator n=1 Tax=Priestia flexa TaxID=86664 RepID=UPI001F4D33B7|nr:ArpU family phage packaging/lysis transcriptional regulator [Priestia flexa]
MFAEQLSFLEKVDEKEVRKIVIQLLKEYRTLKVQVENKKECVSVGVDLFPSLRDSYNHNELKVKQIERALEQSLDDEELLIIEKKYLTSARIKDIEIYIQLGLKKDTYYDMKKRAMNRIATALGVI